ncbi:substrate-binding domain-containing protein [Methylobacterium sp. AMS5]|uniref:substrate-binding domain-containing protein n=1 Tax=Methylobacterium sp. AMS5 TaxID=925818 RepID=UPI00074F9F01|nr:substrate-binding domain-containing protein [Methylobacterium sp. AMS5]AMB46064.1 rhizopine-binding protein [Methylobacterium sp. AMS5]
MKQLNRPLPAALLLIALAAPAAAETRLTFLMPEAGDRFLDSLQSAVISTAASKFSVSVDVAEAAGKGETQVTQARAALEAKPAALIVTPVDDASARTITEMAAVAGIPVVFVNRRPSGPVTNRMAIVSANHLVAGRVQMRMLAQRLGDRGNVAILRGKDSENAAQERTAGVKEILGQRPGLKLLAEASADWSRRQAQDQVTAWLRSGLKLDAIAANNDEMALGAVAALKAAGLSGKVLVGGVDGTSDGIAAVKSGNLSVSVLQDAPLQGAQAVNDAVKLARGEYVQPYDWVSHQLILGGNERANGR